ncbi:MAG TPA: phosphatase PAP2 family protein [Methylomirabilota bacterium]|jgi:undecaprenyl-diphosphatase|nr:phosphatase PAP2 family protein [Methylomirabilota bacterium]
MPSERRWAYLLFAAAAVFIASATIVSLTGVPALERHVYETIIEAVPKAAAFRSITRLGSKDVLLPAAVVLVVLLPRQFLRRWWVWAVVMLAVATLEGFGKVGIGRPRPAGMRLGFPSGHTAAAAAFYLMACYLFEGVVRRWAKYVLYGVAGVLIALVGLSRMVLRVHWPLDVLGGAALGVAVVAAAAWWHERYPLAARVAAPVPAPWQGFAYRWQNVLALALVAVLFVTPPMVDTTSVWDLVFDLSGILCMLAGLALRLWAGLHADSTGLVPVRPPARLVTTGPYALMRHPIPLATLLTGVGVVLLAENGPGLVVVPAALIALYRLVVPYEDALLAARFGPAHAEYCRRVLALPRFAPATLAAPALALRGVDGTSWRTLVRQMPAVAATAALAALAELSEYLPHLLR